jgi:uncharacterized protein (TIGR03643 family)
VIGFGIAIYPNKDWNGTANFKQFSLFLVDGIMNMEQKDIDRIIEMAWEDRTPFEAITFQFQVSEAETIALMRKELKRSSFNLWRKRVNSCISKKHLLKRNPSMNRFKCSLQRSISMNKISKR